MGSAGLPADTLAQYTTDFSNPIIVSSGFLDFYGERKGSGRHFGEPFPAFKERTGKLGLFSAPLF
jgi:hypothetical protein